MGPYSQDYPRTASRVLWTVTFVRLLSPLESSMLHGSYSNNLRYIHLNKAYSIDRPTTVPAIVQDRFVVIATDFALCCVDCDLAKVCVACLQRDEFMEIKAINTDFPILLLHGIVFIILTLSTLS